MNQNILYICIDDFVDNTGFDPRQAPSAVNLRATNREELALAKYKLWEVGQELRIRFLDGTPALHDRVTAYASQWLEYANLSFNFGRHPEAEIRITFQGHGYRSLVGTDALRRTDQKSATMTLGGLRDCVQEERLRAIVLHEFGHAIGCVHEQANPNVDIPWNTSEVYAYYASFGWDKGMVDRNVLMRYRKHDVHFSNHDPLSIMQYPVNKELTNDGFEIGWNTQLSESDKIFISHMYPSAS